MTGLPLDERHGKAAAVQARRTVNDEIAATGAHFEAAVASKLEFVCECGDLRCNAIVTMTLADYAKTTPGSVVGHA